MDMREIQSLFKKYPKYRAYFRMLFGKYPMMNMVFDDQANIKVSIIFENNLTGKNSLGNDENIMGCELSNYILTEGYQSLKNI